MNRSRRPLAAGLFALLVVGSIVAGGAGGVLAGDSSAAATSVADPDEQSTANVSEEAHVVEAPEPGDPYYEASDGNWVSYINPRDEYRTPYLGDGSGKVCVSLFNEAGEPIAGETVPNTTVRVPTGETTSWHSGADPMTVRYPLTDYYERPLDADQFGTTSDLPQGDGYMDSHCIEMHGHPENATIEYGEVRIEGEHADKIEVVGYVQQAHDTWETDIDPIEAAEPYREAGGGWTYRPDASHGQVVVVLQLDSDVTGASGDGPSDIGNSSDAGGEGSNADENETTISEETDDAGADDSGTAEEMPGFGISGVITAVAIVALVALRRSS